jgi:uncharacterized protein (DUF1810 family)
MNGRDPEGLGRFVEAQAPVYPQVIAELRAGRKRSHWMWFVFPQLRGLGRSWRSEYYGLADLAEAITFLRHPLLGGRYRECVQALLAQESDSAAAILGPVDALKLRSSLSLFAAAARAAARSDEAELFEAALLRFFAGEPCPLTAARLGGDAP